MDRRPNHQPGASALPYPLESTIPAGPSSEPEPGPSHQRQRHHQHDGAQASSSSHSPLPAHSDPFALLRRFNTVFLIDDSASMAPYWGQVGALLERAAPVCVERDGNGIDLFFVNHRPRGYAAYCLVDRGAERLGYRHIGRHRAAGAGAGQMRDNVAGILASVRPRGGCRLGRSLARLLDEHLALCPPPLRRPRARGADGRRWPTPLNLIVVTAGEAGDDFGGVLEGLERRLERIDAPPGQVGVQVFRVGDVSDELRDAIEGARGPAGKGLDLPDFLDVTTWSGKPGELSEEALRRALEDKGAYGYGKEFPRELYRNGLEQRLVEMWMADTPGAARVRVLSGIVGPREGYSASCAGREFAKFLRARSPQRAVVVRVYAKNRSATPDALLLQFLGSLVWGLLALVPDAFEVSPADGLRRRHFEAFARGGADGFAAGLGILRALPRLDLEGKKMLCIVDGLDLAEDETTAENLRALMEALQHVIESNRANLLYTVQKQTSLIK
ncbi:hypothetical protein GGS23DRAFT_617152 [Durotheca rogersii]|uniref:uncharacterized protein n=1 Tax=Durotheca rogersii TaxID=419775 RepID=UPI00221E7A90|nr:uncharacterized protein GGS23DRAFT_617152 [Durotheca rogersii]KAI5866066.1 hypothetical protein GGS23DRAFT_617152 [Durotheca rogersii]